jgi:hypothetical protein
VSAEPQGADMLVGWTGAKFDGGSRILEYIVTVDGEEICRTTSPSTCTYPEWQYSTTYEVGVSAVNAIGSSQPMTTSLTTIDDPTPPTIGNTPYPGPILASFAPRTAATGQVITVTGERLNLIDSMFMGNKPVEYNVISANQLRMKVPAGLEDSVYDVIVYSSYGILTVQDALRVMGTPVNEDLAPTPVDPGTDPDSGSGENADADKPADQVDTDRDGQSNAVDPDINGDGTPNALDPDIDGDGIPNDVDPNPIVPNDPEDELSEPRPVPGDNSPQVDEENSLDEAVSDAISSAANSLLPLLLALSAILGVFGALRVRRRLVKTED